MKSEERHHLHENDLAGSLEAWLDRLRPHANQILIGVLVLAVIVVGWFVWQRTSQAQAAKGWGEFASANSPDAFLTVADDHPGTTLAIWARLRAAELFVAQGVRAAISDRKLSDEALQNAEREFQILLQTSHLPRQIRERALYGLAVARESLSGADTQKSIAAYEELLKAYPDSQYAGLAAQRIADLKRDATREFYAWFEKQPRRPEDRPKPKELLGSTGPSLNLGDSPLPWPGDAAFSTPPAATDRPPAPSLPIRSGTPGHSAAPGDNAAQPPLAPAPTTETPSDPNSPTSSSPAPATPETPVKSNPE